MHFMLAVTAGVGEEFFLFSPKEGDYRSNFFHFLIFEKTFVKKLKKLGNGKNNYAYNRPPLAKKKKKKHQYVQPDRKK